MTHGITDISVVYISIFSNSQLMSVINNNNVPSYEHFLVSWNTKQRPVMSTYVHRPGGADLYVVSGRYLWLALCMDSNYTTGP